MADSLTFDRFSIDTGAFELRSGNDPVPVEPLVLDLIIELARHPGKLRTRDDLIETVWGGRIVSDTTISTAVKTARKVLGDTGSDQRLIRTVRGRGFQFVAEVATGPAAEPHASAGARLPVLHIRVSALDDAISPVTTRTLEARLRGVMNRIPFLNIVAPVRAAPDPSTDPVGVGLTHVLDITLARLGDQCEADVVLSEIATGFQKWARTFAVAGEAEIDALVQQIGSKAEPEVLGAMSEYLAAADRTSPQALILAAMRVISEHGWNPRSIATATGLLDEAIAKDGSIPLAHASMSLLNAIGYRVGMLRRDDETVQQAISSAERALALDNRDSVVLGLAGCALCDVGQLSRGEPIIDRALDLDPTNGHAYAARGAAKMMRGDFGAALEPLRKSIEISPADGRLAVWGALLAMAELLCGDVERARKSAERAMARDDCNYLPRLSSVAVHKHIGDETASEQATRELLRVHPEITQQEVAYFVGPEWKDGIWRDILAHRATPDRGRI